jgi:hypothetical protein
MRIISEDQSPPGGGGGGHSQVCLGRRFFATVSVMSFNASVGVHRAGRVEQSSSGWS